MVISDEVIAQDGAAHRRACGYSRAWAVQVILHGGEPLLAGRGRLRQIITELRAALAGVATST